MTQRRMTGLSMWTTTALVDTELLRIDLSKWPISMRMKINAEKLSRNVGNRLATKIKQRLRAGIDGAGRPLKPPMTGGQPLNRTGELIRSIRWKDYWVSASWTKKRQEKLKRQSSYFMQRERSTGRMRKHFFVRGNIATNFALLLALQLTQGQYTRRHHGRLGTAPPKNWDIMGAGTQQTREQIRALTARELKRQLDAGEMGLVAEMRAIAERNARFAAARARRGR